MPLLPTEGLFDLPTSSLWPSLLSQPFLEIMGEGEDVGRGSLLCCSLWRNSVHDFLPFPPGRNRGRGNSFNKVNEGWNAKKKGKPALGAPNWHVLGQQACRQEDWRGMVAGCWEGLAWGQPALVVGARMPKFIVVSCTLRCGTPLLVFPPKRLAPWVRKLSAVTCPAPACPAGEGGDEI